MIRARRAEDLSRISLVLISALTVAAPAAAALMLAYGLSHR